MDGRSAAVGATGSSAVALESPGEVDLIALAGAQELEHRDGAQLVLSR
jgi:hypothetical protein